MAKWTTIVASLVVLVLPAAAMAQTGYYGWSVSASNTNPLQNNPANPGAGVQTLYLWYLGGCYPGAEVGVSAAEFRLVTTNTTWTILAFTPLNNFLNAAGAGDATGIDLLLATPCTGSGQVLAGNILVQSTASPGRVGFGLSVNENKAAGVDCIVFGEHDWPALMRFVGYATTDDANPPQDHGNDCTTTSVNAETWGKVKSLYH